MGPRSELRPRSRSAGRAAESLERPILLETHRPQAKKTLFGLRGKRYSVILDLTERRWELYDLERDPPQHVNLFEPGNPRAAQLARRLLGRLRDETAPVAGARLDAEISEETREMLRSLGYL